MGRLGAERLGVPVQPTYLDEPLEPESIPTGAAQCPRCDLLYWLGDDLDVVCPLCVAELTRYIRLNAGALRSGWPL